MSKQREARGLSEMDAVAALSGARGAEPNSEYHRLAVAGHRPLARTLVSLVLGLPTCGPLLYRALVTQDMFLAASFIMILSTLTVIGTLLSDILLAWIDPRIRFGVGAMSMMEARGTQAGLGWSKPVRDGRDR